MKHFQRNLSKLTKQIYIHSNNNISFGPKDSSLILGQFIGDVKRENFKLNPQFLPIFQDLISEKIYRDFSFIMEASINANSFMPIYDFRDIPRYGRIPEIDNVFGYLQVDKDGQMLKDSYQRNDLYQVYNHHGLPVLSDYLYEEVGKL